MTGGHHPRGRFTLQRHGASRAARRPATSVGLTLTVAPTTGNATARAVRPIATPPSQTPPPKTDPPPHSPPPAHTSPPPLVVTSGYQRPGRTARTCTLAQTPRERPTLRDPGFATSGKKCPAPFAGNRPFGCFALKASDAFFPRSLASGGRIDGKTSADLIGKGERRGPQAATANGRRRGGRLAGSIGFRRRIP